MEQIILDEVYFYISNKDITKQEVAKNFGRSLSSISKDFQKFRQYVLDNPGCSYEKWYDLMTKKATHMVEVGRMKGSKALGTGKEAMLSDDEVIRIAKDMLIYGKTVRDMAGEIEMPKSTLYNNLTRIEELDSELYQKLKILFFENTHRGSYEGKRKF